MDENILSPLNQDIPERIEDIIDFLSSRKKPGRSFIVSYLLDCDAKWRKEISSGIDTTLEKQRKVQRPLPFSIYGDIKLTVFCWQSPNIPRDKQLALEHGTAAMVIAGNSERLVIELLFDKNKNIVKIDWESIQLDELTDEQLIKAKTLAETLRQKRIKKVGKVGRNDPCPCGSGKKFKKCCLNKP
ncbi:hypothetical protein GYB29_05510 [bacterium]|nr:hypothetical protein [bacterium]